jgi:hypothetical protein
VRVAAARAHAQPRGPALPQGRGRGAWDPLQVQLVASCSVAAQVSSTHTRNLPFSCLHDTLGLDTSYTFLPSHGLGLLRNFSLYPSDWFCHLGQLGRLKQGGERPWL